MGKILQMEDARNAGLNFNLADSLVPIPAAVATFTDEQAGYVFTKGADGYVLVHIEDSNIGMVLFFLAGNPQRKPLLAIQHLGGSWSEFDATSVSPEMFVSIPDEVLEAVERLKTDPAFSDSTQQR
jgi:hypothetical protein